MGRLSAAGEIRSLGWLGRCIRCWVRWGRRTAATGGLAPARGTCPAGTHPPFSFPSCGKENGLCTVQKKRPLLVATLHIRAKLLHGSRRIGACSDLGWPTGTLCSSARAILPSRGGWYGGHRGARTHLSCFSFRAFRFATRCLGGRGGLYRRADEGIRPYNGGDGFRYPRRGRCPHRPVAEAFINHRPAAATAQPLAALPLTDAAYPLRVKSAQNVSLYFPGLAVSPRAARFRP